MFVARQSTPPTMQCFKGLDMGSTVEDNYRKYPIVTVHIHLRCIATELLTAIGSHAS